MDIFILNANFKTYLVNNTTRNTNDDSEIQVTKITDSTGVMNYFNLNIKDLTGIKSFYNSNLIMVY